MRDARALGPEPALDAISAQLGELMRRADALLAEWSTFGDEVRVRVAREVATIGEVVAAAIDRAALDTTAAGIERQFADQLATRLSALGTELSRLEGRVRATSRVALDDRRGDRRVLWAGLAGIAIANVLLAMILLRPPATVPPLAPPIEPARVELVPPVDAAPPIDAAPDAAPPHPDAAPVAKHPARAK